MPTIQERLTLILNRSGYNTEVANKIIAEISKDESEEVDLESLINEFDTETEKVVSNKKTFHEKYVKPKVDEETNAEFKSIRGTILSKVATQTGMTTEEINKLLANSDKKFAETIIQLVENITYKKANLDELSKSEITSLKAKEEKLNALLEDAGKETEKAKKQSEKAEQNYYKKGVMLDAFTKLTGIVVGNPDFVKDVVFSKVSELYDIDTNNGKLLHKGTDKYALTKSAKDLELKDVMYDILDANKLISKKAEDDSEKKKAPIEQPKTNTKYYKET